MINIDVINHVAADNEDGGGGGGNSISTLQADLILRDINFRGTREDTKEAQWGDMASSRGLLSPRR